MSMRAIDKLYLTAGGALVRESNPAGRTLYCNPGDVISDADLVTYRAYFEAFGWIKLAVLDAITVKIQSVKIRHDNVTNAVAFDIPARSIIQDIYVRCTENAAGSPDIDFGEYGGDTDGILDGIGQVGICDTTTTEVDTSPDFKGRGDLITCVNNENHSKTKVQKYYPAATTLVNTCNTAGTAGEWIVTIVYITLPEL